MSNGVHGLSVTTRGYGLKIKCKVTGKEVIAHTQPENGAKPIGLTELCARDKTMNSFHTIDELCGALHVVDDLDGAPYDSGHLAQAQCQTTIPARGDTYASTFAVCSANGRWFQIFRDGEFNGDYTGTPLSSEQIARLDRMCRVRHRDGGVAAPKVTDYTQPRAEATG